MYTSDVLSWLHNLTDTPDNKDVTPLNFLQHFTPNYIEHTYSHLVEDLYAHRMKDSDTTSVNRKRGRPPNPKPETTNSKSTTAAFAHTARPRQMTKISNNEIISRDLIANINAE